MRGKQLITTLMVAAAVVVLVFATVAAIDGIDITAGGRFLGNHPAVTFSGQSPIEVSGVSQGNAAQVYVTCPTCGAGSGNFNPSGTGAAGYTLEWLGDSPLSYGWRASPPGVHVANGQYLNGAITLGLTDGSSFRIPGIPQPDGVVTSASLSGGTLTLDRSGTLTDITVGGFGVGGADGVLTRLSYTSPDLTATLSVGNDVIVTLPDWLTTVTSDGTMSGSGTTASPLHGYENSDADARVRAGVENWAETGNTDRIPSTKMSFGYGYVPAAQAGILAVQTSPTNISIANAEQGSFTDTYLVPQTTRHWVMVGLLNALATSSLADYVVTWANGTHSVPFNEWTLVSGTPVSIPAQAYTYYHLEIDAIPAGRARIQHLIQIDEDLIPDPTTDATLTGTGKTGDPLRVVPGQSQVDSEVIERVIYSHIRAVPAATPEDDDGVLFRDNSAGPAANPRARVTFSDLDTRWVDRDDPTYVDLTESFTGGTWTAATAALIASNNPLAAQPTSSTPVEGYTYVTTLTTGPRYTNQWTVVRIPADDRDEAGSWRLFQDETDDPSYYNRSDWVFVKTVGSYAYFAIQIADRPSSVNYRMQNLTSPYELNRDKVDVACAVQDSRIFVVTKAAATAFTGAEFLSANAVDIECGQTLRTASYTGGGNHRIGIAIPADEDLYFTTVDRAVVTFGLQSGGAIPISGSNYDVWTSSSLAASDVSMFIVVGDE